MTPRIETLSEKKLVGSRLRMSLTDSKIGELWRTFSPRRKEITNIAIDKKGNIYVGEITGSKVLKFKFKKRLKMG